MQMYAYQLQQPLTTSGQGEYDEATMLRRCIGNRVCHQTSPGTAKT